ncbi:hypothetical protein [Candidatus Rhodoluna planktonica]|uniref:Uncharacterized protein n=1 Tax=Candidatus Rhodoluna planktonica TaxID=535712 RepID=A0A1D9DYN2_9MICO|nr:hypothetical protein [Candidatus Rhodoluna planktonica]AOY55909.1 hypothetical protein A4Z71_02670 [Candidatus Rhodoluna planktonica]
MEKHFVLPDQQSLLDMQSFLTRAKRLDSEGMVRFRAFGSILASYVAPIFSGSLMDAGPTVLGLRTTELYQEVELDVVVSISAVLDRIAKLSGRTDGPVKLELPLPQRAVWAGISPPRQGWVQTGTLNETKITNIAREGIAEVAAALPESVGGPIAARIRGEIWGRGIDLESKLPTGAAFVAAGLGFLTENEEVGVFQTDGWVRLSSMHGHVLAKAAIKFASL